MKMMQQGHAAVAVSANARRMLEWLNLNLDRDNGLDVQDILRPSKRTYSKVTAVLDWNTNEPSHGVLDSLLQTCCSITSGVACDEDACCAADGVSAQRKHQSNNAIRVSFAANRFAA